eukprot:gene9436-biopygen18215
MPLAQPAALRGAARRASMHCGRSVGDGSGRVPHDRNLKWNRDSPTDIHKWDRITRHRHARMGICVLYVPTGMCILCTVPTDYTVQLITYFGTSGLGTSATRQRWELLAWPGLVLFSQGAVRPSRFGRARRPQFVVQELWVRQATAQPFGCREEMTI